MKNPSVSSSSRRSVVPRPKRFHCIPFNITPSYSKDLRKAVDSLHKLGSDFKILNTGSKRVICSVSIELS